MNLMKSTRSVLQNSKWMSGSIQKVKLIHKKSLPPLAKTTEAKELEEIKSTEIPLGKGEKVQRDIFGATILPQNLSFENAKRLSDNQVNLKDIPLVDENDVAEMMAAVKVKASSSDHLKSSRKDVIEAVVVPEPEPRKSVRDSFWTADPYDDIPGPKIFRNLAYILKQCALQLTIVSLLRFLKTNRFALFRVYGPVVKLPEALGGKIVLISRPEHMSAVFEQDQRYPFNSALDSVQRCRSQRRKKRNRVDHLSEEWEEIKGTVSEPTTKGLVTYFDHIDEAAIKFVRRIKTIKNRQDEVPSDFLLDINKWSLECLCSVVFDKPYGFLDYESASGPSKTSQLLYTLTAATKKLRYLENGPQFWRFLKTSSLSSLGHACDVLESIISEYVGQVQLGLIKRREGFEELRNVSLVEGLLLREDLPPDEIVSRILDTLLIGVNTMSSGLGFLFYHLSQNPSVQVEVRKEIKEILPEKYSRLEPEHLSSLRYLQACLKESLRLKMSMPIMMRTLSRNVILSNYQVPKGTFLVMIPQIEGLKEENFDNPNEYLPERWLDQESVYPFASIPTRHYFEDSVERQIAEASVWVCASQVLRHFSVEYLYEDIDATIAAVSFPTKPLRFTFSDRKD